MGRVSSLLLALLTLGFVLLAGASASAQSPPGRDLIARGKYVFGATGGCGCKDTGLTWTEEEIAEFLESGAKPDGDGAQGLMDEVIHGTAGGYKDLTKADRLAIARYLKAVPPVRNKVAR